ncbi:DNA replication/repair protein RecF [Legionella spiritensis]|uniref:DNA replication and repair protein RecF n=1 Tax=Legionella spiritensis TaxID=452 RepID=A0A0W0ZA52_LEGSP|nr:DNA replication/repair protein RecF [Legionella spiritensis]KTD65991.1 RecF recombinational DNA repair ATPase [Legionella spiritensis]SNV23459.1 RecF recombinational DNA repair ATPase [Legionella spiritensis]
MTLAQLQIHHLRNLSQVRVDLHPEINVITGVNGSGKTSFLEALYLLGCGHSFRSREISSLVSFQQSELVVFAKTCDEQTISISKSLSAPTSVRINTNPCLSNSELARFLPIQVFYQDIFQIIDAGPSVRRSLLDWGLFHVKHDYHQLWKNYKRSLKQRSILLKQRAQSTMLAPWNKLLAELGEQLHVMRQDYVDTLDQTFQKMLPRLTDVSCRLHYYKGWDKRGDGKSLLSVLNDTIEQDLQRQFTHYGAHQADILFQCDEHKARHFLSRGQQKILLFALKFAQALLLDKPCLFLIDDVAAELDEHHLYRLLQYIKDNDGQYFLTTHSNQPLLNLFGNSNFQTYRLGT